MNDRPEMCVVEIEGMRRDPVHQRPEHDVQAIAAPQHSCIAWPRKRSPRGDGSFDRLMTRPSNRAADPVEQRPRGFGFDGRSQVRLTMRDNELRERSGWRGDRGGGRAVDWIHAARYTMRHSR